MTDSIWTLKADASSAVKALGDTVDPLQKVAGITEEIGKQGGVAGVLAGNSDELTAQQKIIEQLTDELTQQEKALDSINQQMRTTGDTDAYKKLTADAKTYQEQINSIKSELNGLVPSEEQGAELPGGGNDAMFRASALRPLQTGARALNMTTSSAQATQAAYTITAITDVGDTIGLLKNDLKDLSEPFHNFIGGVKDFAGLVSEGGLSALPEIIGGITAAISPITLIAGGAVLALLAVGKVLDTISQYADAAAKAAQDYNAKLQQEEDLKNQINQFSQKGDIQGATSQLQQYTAEMQKQGDLMKAAQGEIQAANDAYANLGSSFNPILRAGIGSAGQQYQQQYDDAKQKFDAAQAAFKQLSDSMGDIAKQYQAAQAADNLKNAEQDLTNTRVQARDAAKQLQQQIAQFQSDSAYNDMKTQRDRDRQDQVALDQHNKDMAKIVADGQKQVEQIVKQSQKTIADEYKQYEKAEADAVKQLNISLTDADTQYQKTALKNQQAFQKQEAQADAQFAKDDLRRRQDLHNQQMSLELQNDVVGFIQAKQQADVTEQRAREDFADQEKQAQDNYAQQAQDLKDSLADQKDQLVKSYKDQEETRAENFADQLATEKQNEQDQLQQQRENLVDQLNQSAEAYKEQQAQTAQQRAWQDADTKEANARQLKQMQTAYDDQQQALKSHEADLLGVIQSGGTQQLATVTYQQLQLVSAYQSGTDKIIQAVQSQLANANFNVGGGGDLGGTYGGSSGQLGYGIGSALGSAYKTFNDVAGLFGFGAGSLGAASGYGGGGSGSGSIGMFAEGGVVDRPTLAVLGERYKKEAVIPLTPSGGLPSNLGGAPSIHFGNITIGAGMSQDAVIGQIKLMGQTILRAMQDSKSGAPIPQR